MNDVNTVTLDTRAYNCIKAENQKCMLFLDNLLANATLAEDKSKLVFDSDKISLAMSVLYDERYKKKLSALRSLATKGKL